MAKAVWNGAVIAESDDADLVVVEGNHYFPRESLDDSYVRPSDHTTVCGWKGEASYFHLEVDGARNENAAWTYRDPKPAAAEIRDRVAFWKGVAVEA